MKALSVIQPWAEAIVRCGKDVENRTQFPPTSVLGATIAIHASKKWDRDCEADLLQVWARAPANKRARDSIEIRRDIGCVVGLAKVVGWFEVDGEANVSKLIALEGHIDQVRQATRSAWYMGYVGIVLADQIALPRPIPAKGALGYWNVPDHIALDAIDQWHLLANPLY